MIWYRLISHSEIWHTLNPLGRWLTLQVSRAPRSLLAPRKHPQACNVSSYSTYNILFSINCQVASMFHSTAPAGINATTILTGSLGNSPASNQVLVVKATHQVYCFSWVRWNAAQCAHLNFMLWLYVYQFRKKQQYDYDNILISWLRRFALTSLHRLRFRSRGSKHHLHFDHMTGRNGFRCDTEVVWVWRPKTSPFEDHEAKTQQVQQTWLPHALEILFKENTTCKDGSKTEEHVM